MNELGFIFIFLLFLIADVQADFDFWLQSPNEETRFNETQSYLEVHSTMYPDWYHMDKFHVVDPTDRLHEFTPNNFNNVYAKFDQGSFCTLLNYAGADGGMLLVGGRDTVRFTIQLASLLRAKHCSVTCSDDVSCTYCICDGQQKLAFIRNDDLSTDHSYSNGQCSLLQSKHSKSRRHLAETNRLCQSWASKQVLSQFSVIVLNQDITAGNDRTVNDAMDFLISNSKASQTLMMRSSVLPKNDCTANVSNSLNSLPPKYRDRVHVMDVLAPSLSYSTRHANITSPQSLHAGNGGKVSHSSDPNDMTNTMPVDGGRRNRRDRSRRQLRRASSPSATEYSCVPFDTESSVFTSFDFHLYWSDLLYTTLLLSHKPILFDSQPCCTATTLDIAQQQLVTIEFSLINYMLAFQSMDSVLHFKTPTTNLYDVVVLSVADIAYEEAFSSWFRTKDSIVPLHNNSIHSFIIGIDEATCDYLGIYGRPFLCFYYSVNFVKTFRTKGVPLRLAIGVSKLVYPSLFLRYGYNVLFSEMDIFWRGDPIGTDLQTEANEKYDIQVSGHVDFWPRFITLPEELNIGIFYVRSTHTSRGMFQDMLRYTCTHPHLMGTLGSWDQKLFDHFIRTDVPTHETAPYWGEHFVNWQSFITTNESVIWRRLPGELYTHNQGQLIRVFPQTMAVHISWGKGPPSERIYCASQLGLVPSVPRFDEQYKGVQCFSG